MSDSDSDFEPDESSSSEDEEDDSNAATDSESEVIDSAIINGLTTKVKMLLDKGLDPNKVVRGDPILILATRAYATDIVRLLLDRGADPNIKRIRGETALFTSSNSDIVDSLIQHGADVNIKNDNGDTPLSRSASLDDIPMVKLLVARGADVNTKDNYGQTPLMKAVDQELTELLIRLGADPNIRDNSGLKASDYAVTGREKSTLRILEKRFSKKGILPSKHGRITPHWMEICNTLGTSGLYDLRQLIIQNIDKRHFDLVSQFFTSSSFNDVDEFLDYIQGLNKREICAGLAKYYTKVKPVFLTSGYVRGSVRPISEMARKSIQSKRRKSSLYSLAYRKARQTDPEKFREYVSQFDLPNP
jgi:hypothetical protein